VLLDAGSNVEVPNQEGQTALMLAARAGSLDVAELLVRHGAMSMHEKNGAARRR
jgi:ankyrin repeat protein